MEDCEWEDFTETPELPLEVSSCIGQTKTKLARFIFLFTVTLITLHIHTVTLMCELRVQPQ